MTYYKSYHIYPGLQMITEK